MPVTVLAQSPHVVESHSNPSLLEVAARVQRIVEAHEATLAAEKATAGKEVAKAPHKPTTTAAQAQRVRTAQRVKTAPRVGLRWRVTLVWPEELRGSADTTPQYAVPPSLARLIHADSRDHQR